MRKAMKDAAYTAARIAGPKVKTVRAILMYHDVGGPAGPTPELFRRQIAEISARSRVIPLRSLPDVLASRDPLTVVTFDDGYADTIDAVEPILREHGVVATFFVPSGLLGQMFSTSFGEQRLMTEDAVRSLAASGHEIGGHTRSHTKLTVVSPQRAKEEIEADRRALSAVIGSSVSSFAYPKGDHDDAVREMVRDAGYQLAVTVREDLLHGALDPWTLPRILVNGTMGMTQFRAKLSGGLRTYEALRGRR